MQHLGMHNIQVQATNSSSLPGAQCSGIQKCSGETQVCQLAPQNSYLSNLEARDKIWDMFGL